MSTEKFTFAKASAIGKLICLPGFTFSGSEDVDLLSVEQISFVFENDIQEL